MNDIKRRDAIKSLGVISLSTLSASFPDEFYNGNLSQIEDDEIFTDILVVGGGTAGVIAALQATRAGCKTTIIEIGSQLGGTITTGGVAFPGLFHAWGNCTGVMGKSQPLFTSK
ncbi:MAG: FAD-dependent oxidoreductase [Bacteroidota bacterium]